MPSAVGNITAAGPWNLNLHSFTPSEQLTHCKGTKWRLNCPKCLYKDQSNELWEQDTTPFAGACSRSTVLSGSTLQCWGNTTMTHYIARFRLSLIPMSSTLPAVITDWSILSVEFCNSTPMCFHQWCKSCCWLSPVQHISVLKSNHRSMV